MKIFRILLAVVFYLQISSVQANFYKPNEETPQKSIVSKSHSLVAPEGTRYQWYLNGLKIEDAIHQELEVNSAGIYRLEMTDIKGDVLEKQTIIGLTAAGAIIRIFTIGDSTVQDYTAGYYPRKGWGQVLPIFFNTANVTVINKAVGGTSSKSFYNSFWPAVRDGLQAGDFVFIQFGINDRNNADPARYTPTGGEFESYLTKYVNETKAKGAFPVLVATLRRNAWNADGTVYDAYHDHPVATRTVAKSLGVPLIDLDAKAKVLLESVGQTYSTRLLYNNYVAGEYPNYPNGNTDNVHFQEMGAIEMAKLVAQGIRELSTDPNVKKLIPFLKPEYQIAVYVNPVGSDQVTTHTTTYPQGLTITLKTIPKTTSTFQKWNNAAGTQLSTATLTTVTSGITATSYTAMYKGAANCIASITSPSTSFCAGGSIVLTASSGNSYKWFNGTTQVGTASTYTATTAGSYTVEVINTTGCKATSAAKVITVNALPAAKITYAGLTTFCTGGSVVLTSSAGASYKWFNGTTQVGTASAYTATASGSYTVEVSNSSGCKATSSATKVTVNTFQPTTITAPTTSICPGGSVVLTASAGVSYKWRNGTTQVGTASTYTATTAGGYYVEVTNASGCQVSSSVIKITVSDPPIATISSSATSFCAGSSVLLTASTGTSYKWFNGTTQVGTAATYTATAAGSYTVEVTNSSGCKATSAPTVVTVGSAQQTPTISSPSTSFCAGSSVLLTASTGTSYKWFNGTTQVGTASTYTATAAGSYTVEVTNSSGCKATSAPTVVTVGSAQQTPTISSPSTSFCAGSSVLLTASTGTSYKWFNGTTQVGTVATYTATAAGSYTVEVTNAAGCKATSAPREINSTQPKTWYADTDGDGLGDPNASLTVCWQPTGYVDVAGDLCLSSTDNNCLDCAGTPNGMAVLDNCNICTGGTTGKTACIPTSTTTMNGTTATITVVPQPFQTNTTITVENYGKIKTITIVSASGVIVENISGLNTTEINIGESLTAGLYSVIIQTENGVYTTKIVKK